MPALGPVKRKELIRRLRQAGFEGPYAGGNHQYMQRGQDTVRIPNPHQADIGKSLLARILREAGISRREWEKL